MSRKLLSTVAGLVAIMAVSPALADCSSAMKTGDEMMMKMTDTAKKEMAMKEVAMAKDMMAKQDETGCMMHMDKAMQEMK